MKTKCSTLYFAPPCRIIINNNNVSELAENVLNYTHTHTDSHNRNINILG